MAPSCILENGIKLEHPNPPSVLRWWFQQLIPALCHECRRRTPPEASPHIGTLRDSCQLGRQWLAGCRPPSHHSPCSPRLALTDSCHVWVGDLEVWPHNNNQTPQQTRRTDTPLICSRRLWSAAGRAARRARIAALARPGGAHGVEPEAKPEAEHPHPGPSPSPKPTSPRRGARPRPRRRRHDCGGRARACRRWRRAIRRAAAGRSW